jgi:phage terminase large subunit-like protein
MEPSMATRPRHQLVVLSTAGDAQSFYLWRKVLAGRNACETGNHGRTAYFEWSAPDDADPSDPETWRSCSPALGITITERFLEGQWEKALRGGQEGINKFRRSYLNQWPEIPVLDEATFQVVPSGAWAAVADRQHEPAGKLVFALDVDSNAQGVEWCSVAMSDGCHAEIVTPADSGPGLDWVVPAVVEKRDLFQEILLEPSGPAGKLIAPLEQAGIRVRKVKAAEFVQACGQMVDKVANGRMRHLDQPVLNRAVAGAARRDVGDGNWKLSRTRSSVDVSALVAVTIALWAAQTGAVDVAANVW